MFETPEQRTAKRAEHVPSVRRAQLAERIAELPGVRADVVGERVVLSGRRLHRRRLTDPALRWLGRWMR